MNVPIPRGKKVDIHMCVDSDHAKDKVSHMLRSGFMTYMTTSLVQWFSKKQCTVKTSIFGPEFVAMKQGIDAPRDLRYKLRMMDIPISGPSNFYGNNMSLVHYTSKPESIHK